MCMPLRNWFVLTTSAIGGEVSGCADGPRHPFRAASARDASADEGELLREGGEQLDAVVAQDREVLDPDAAEPGQVDARLDRDHVAGAKHVLGLGREPRRLVDGEATPWPRPWPNRAP